jgi:very-short-patch-repair endonuclease
MSRASTLTARARLMRREATPGERALWRGLARDQLGYGFRRQYRLGDYIVDFACLPRRVVVELDGGQHNGEAKAYDERRDAWLRGQGFRVLRFWNSEVFQNLDGVVETIIGALRAPSPRQSSTVGIPPQSPAQGPAR